MNRMIRAGIFFLNGIYALIKLLPTQNKIVMLSRQSNSPSMEFEMLKGAILKYDKRVKVVLLSKMLGRGIKSKAGYCLHMLFQMYHIATAQVAILDSYCIVVSVLKHKKSLKVIQMWHSMGTMKKFGYSALDTEEGTGRELAYAMKMHRNYDYIFASSEAYKEDLAKGFNYGIEKIITMPLPRLDLLKSNEYCRKKRTEIYKKYPTLKEKPVILYCPTFRKNEDEFANALDKLAQALKGKEYNLVVKLHPLSKVTPPHGSFTADGFSSFEMLFIADYLISDYSCIIYEAAVKKIPLYFYNFDMEIYEKNRGLAIDYYNELPGVISKEAEEIIRAIEEQPYDLLKLQRFADKYVTPVNNVTEKIVKFIFKIKKEEKEGNIS